MKNFFLEDPVYTEPEQSVRLILKNNIVMRQMRQSDHMEASMNSDVWNQLDDLEKKILIYMGSRLKVTRAELENHTGKVSKTITDRLKHLIALHLVKRNGRKYDPSQNYEML